MSDRIAEIMENRDRLNAMLDGLDPDKQPIEGAPDNPAMPAVSEVPQEMVNPEALPKTPDAEAFNAGQVVPQEADPQAQIEALTAQNAKLQANYDNLRSYSDRTMQALRAEIAALKLGGAQAPAINVLPEDGEQPATQAAAHTGTQPDSKPTINDELRRKAQAAKEDYGEVGELLAQLVDVVDGVNGRIDPLAEVAQAGATAQIEEAQAEARSAFDAAMMARHADYMAIKSGQLTSDFMAWCSIRPHAQAVVESGTIDQIDYLLTEYKASSPGYRQIPTTPSLSAAELDNEGNLPRRPGMQDPAARLDAAVPSYTRAQIRALQQHPEELRKHMPAINAAAAAGRIYGE